MSAVHGGLSSLGAHLLKSDIIGAGSRNLLIMLDSIDHVHLLEFVSAYSEAIHARFLLALRCTWATNIKIRLQTVNITRWRV